MVITSFLETLEKYSYSINFSEHGQYIDIEIKLNCKFKKNREKESTDIPKEEIISFLKPIIKKRIRKHLKRWYKGI